MRTPLRLGLFYAALNLGGGVATPYFALWFKAQGLDGRGIGLILATPMLARIVTAPALAVWADGWRLRRTPLVLLCGGGALAYAALAVGRGFWAWLPIWFVANSLMSVTAPLTDAATLRLGAAEGFGFGFPRGLGSAAFIVGDVAGGALVGRLGAGVVWGWTVAAAVLAAAVARYVVPAMPAEAGGERPRGLSRFAGLGGLVRDRTFMLAVVSAGLVNATHAFYYGFSALLWRAQGLSPGLIGWLWGSGVAVEVAFLWFGEPWRRRLGPARLLVLGAGGAVVRWTAYAFGPPVWALFPLQALHALSFAAAYVGGVELVQRLSPPGTATAAQSLNAALGSGLLIGLATLASGGLYDAVGARGYLAMSAVAALGLAGAVALQRRAPPA